MCFNNQVVKDIWAVKLAKVSHSWNRWKRKGKRITIIKEDIKCESLHVIAVCSACGFSNKSRIHLSGNNCYVSNMK